MIYCVCVDKMVVVSDYFSCSFLEVTRPDDFSVLSVINLLVKCSNVWGIQKSGGWAFGQEFAGSTPVFFRSSPNFLILLFSKMWLACGAIISPFFPHILVIYEWLYVPKILPAAIFARFIRYLPHSM